VITMSLPPSPRRARPQLERLESRRVLSAPAGPTFIAVLYQGLLGQNPDGTALAAYQAQLDAGVPRGQVAAEVINTPPFQTREVQTLYLTLLGRGADQAGLNTWLRALQSGASVNQVKANLLGSDEFFARAGRTGGGFLNALFLAELNRAPDASATPLLGAGLNGAAGRRAVALQVLTSPEAAQFKVANAYQEVLGRAPDAMGASYWADVLRRGGSDEALLAGLLGSDEFFTQLQRFVAQPGTNDPVQAGFQFITAGHKFQAPLPAIPQAPPPAPTPPGQQPARPAQVVNNVTPVFVPVAGGPFFDPFVFGPVVVVDPVPVITPVIVPDVTLPIDPGPAFVDVGGPCSCGDFGGFTDFGGSDNGFDGGGF
jgi:hypothetical protein